MNLDKNKFVFIVEATDTADKIYTPSINYWQDAWRRLKQNKVAIACMVFLIILTCCAIILPMLSRYNDRDVNMLLMNQAPSMENLFGTDDLGRDLWCRVWMGARVSLLIALIAAVVQATIGIIVGGISGFFGGKIDTIIMRASDIIDSVPFLIYVTLAMVVLGSGMIPIIIAFALTGWIRMARLVRGQALQLKNLDFVKAAQGLGAGNFRIILQHIVPNMLGVIIVTLTMSIPSAIFTEAYLSYIGVGLRPPLTSWGQLANAGAEVMRTYPYQLIIPAVFICLTMLSLQLLGDGLRDALDPKLRK